jgi:hypothetical protein
VYWQCLPGMDRAWSRARGRGTAHAGDGAQNVALLRYELWHKGGGGGDGDGGGGGRVDDGGRLVEGNELYAYGRVEARRV